MFRALRARAAEGGGQWLTCTDWALAVCQGLYQVLVNLRVKDPLCYCESHVRLCGTPWTVAHQARIPLSMGFSRQENWSGLPFPSPGNLPGIEPRSPEILADSLPSEPPGKPCLAEITFQHLSVFTVCLICDEHCYMLFLSTCTTYSWNRYSEPPVSSLCKLSW